MATKKTKMIDSGAAPFLGLSALICLALLILTATSGSRSSYFVFGPLFTSCILVFSFLVGGSAVTREQVSSRINHGRITDAILFYRSSFLGTLVFSLLLSLFTLFSAEKFSTFFFGQRYSDLSIRFILPFVILTSLIGPMKGFLDSVGMRRFSILGLLILGAFSFVFSLIFAGMFRTRGAKISLLLRNDSLVYVYGGAGFALGFSVGALIAFVFFFVITVAAVHSLRREQDTLQMDRDEQSGKIILFYYRQMLSYLALFLIPALVLWTDFRIGLSDAGIDARGGYQIANWSGFVGGAVPIIVICTMITVVGFTRFPKLCARDYERGKQKTLRLRFSMMMRLSAFLSIPMSFFLFGAGKPIIQILHNGLDRSARNSAVVTLKLGGGIVFLASLSILFAMFLWKSYFRPIVLIAGGVAFILQVLVQYLFLNLLSYKIEAIPIAISMFFFFFLLTAYILGRRDLLARTDTSFIGDFLRIIGASVVADLPVVLLNDFMTEEIIPVGGTVILLIIYILLFAVMSLWFQAADLIHYDKIPGGKYIYRLAQVMHLT